MRARISLPTHCDPIGSDSDTVGNTNGCSLVLAGVGVGVLGTSGTGDGVGLGVGTSTVSLRISYTSALSTCSTCRSSGTSSWQAAMNINRARQMVRHRSSPLPLLDSL